MDSVLIPAMLVGLIAAYPGWILCQKAFFTSRWRSITAIMCVLLAPVIATPFFYLTFWLYQDSEVAQMDLFIDFLLYGVCPVGLMALIAYVLDHLAESPLRAMVAGCACFAIALLPFLYYFFAGSLIAEMAISIKP